MHDGARGADRHARRSCSSAPAHTFVGYFIGSPGMNVLPARGRGRDRAVVGRRRRSPLGRGYGAAGRHASRSACGPSSRASSAGERAAGHASRRVEDVGRHRIVRADARRPADQHPRAPRASRVPAGQAPRRLRSRAASASTPTAGASQGSPAGEGRLMNKIQTTSGLVPGAAGAGAGGVLGGDPADDGGQLLGAGHLRQQRVLLERPRLVRGPARTPTGSGTRCGAAARCSRRSSSPSRCRSASSWRCTCPRGASGPRSAWC